MCFSSSDPRPVLFAQKHQELKKTKNKTGNTDQKCDELTFGAYLYIIFTEGSVLLDSTDMKLR